MSLKSKGSVILTQTERIYLDIGGKRKSTDFSFLTGQDTATIFFILTYNDYFLNSNISFQMDIDIIEKNSFKVEYSKKITSSDILYDNDIPYISLTLPQIFLVKENAYNIDINVLVGSVYTSLPNFLMFFNATESYELKQIKKTIEAYNKSLEKYLNTVKRDQINQPSGVIGLDDSGRMDISVLPPFVNNHIQDKIMASEVHGLRLRKDYFLEYYDTISEQWLMVDRLEGGEFNTPQKDIIVDAGTF